MNLSELVESANAPFTSAYRNKVVNGGAGREPRFELYHAAPSLCSMKVRTVLAEKQAAYHSHDLNLMLRKAEPPECYLPGYVRLRLEGAPDAELASGYTGQSSMTTEGFDPCVVPTLVDHEAERVVVDSASICAYIDEQTGGHRLIPETLSNEVGAQVALVDQAPHVAVLYGAHPDGDVRPPALSRNITGVHAKKIAAIEGLKAEVGDDPRLTAAYDSKIAKESGGADFMLDAERMREAHREMDAHVDKLEAQLATHDGPWALGERFTLADVMWTVSLFRMKWLGIGGAWEEDASRGKVRSYVERAFARPSFRAGVFDWPGAYPPSPHVPEMSGIGATLRFLLEMFRRNR